MIEYPVSETERYWNFSLLFDVKLCHNVVQCFADDVIHRLAVPNCVQIGAMDVLKYASQRNTAISKDISMS